MVCKVLWSHSLNTYLFQVAVNTHSCSYIWVLNRDWRSQKISRFMLDLIPSKGGNSFETHFWVGHSYCWGIFLLTDIIRRIEFRLRNTLVAFLKLCHIGLMQSAPMDGAVSFTKKYWWPHLAKPLYMDKLHDRLKDPKILRNFITFALRLTTSRLLVKLTSTFQRQFYEKDCQNLFTCLRCYTDQIKHAYTNGLV